MAKIFNENGWIKYTIEEDEIVIDNIKVYKQRLGTGTKLINDIKELAKELNKPITLYAEPQDDTINDNQLKEFYISQGFDYHPDNIDNKYFIYN
jgi:hypothetical protein